MKNSIASVLGIAFGAAGLFCAVSAVRADQAAASPPATQPAPDPTPRPGGDPETMLQYMQSRVETLNLSDDQKQKIDDAFAAASRSFKLAEQELQNATPKQRAEHLRDVYQQLLQTIRSTLTPEQLKQFRQMMAAAPGQMLDRLRGALSKLDLSDDQKQKVREVLDDARSKFQQIAADAKAAGASADAGDKLRAVGQETREKLADILSDEQKLKLQRLLANPAPPATQP